MRVHQKCPLLRTIPVSPTTTPDPYPPPIVCVMLTASPLLSAAPRWVVDCSGAVPTRLIRPAAAPPRRPRPDADERAALPRPAFPSAAFTLRETTALSSATRPSESIQSSGTATNH